MSAAWVRVRRSFAHRPWFVDVISSVTALAWGLRIVQSPEGLTGQTAFDFLDAVPPQLVGLVVALFGVSQFAGAAFNVLAWRWANAFLGVWLWAYFAFGIFQSAPRSVGWVSYAGWSFANCMILLRLY